MSKMMTTTSALFMLYLHDQRQKRGAKWCRDNLVGRLRRLATDPPHIIDIAMEGVPPTTRLLSDARQLLAIHCSICGKCELSKQRMV